VASRQQSSKAISAEIQRKNLQDVIDDIKSDSEPLVAKVQMPERFKGIAQAFDFKCFFGGRGSAKTTSVALHLLLEGATTYQRVICTREIQKSVSNSVHQALVDLNAEYNFGYEVTETSLFHPLTGTIFQYMGLKSSTTSIKGLSGVTRLWIEEAENISERSWSNTLTTIRDDNAEIFITFNPFRDDDPTYLRFVAPFLSTIKNSPDGRFSGTLVDGGDSYLIQEVNIIHNPFASARNLREAKALALSDPKQYRHKFLGEPIGDFEDSLILGDHFDACINLHREPKAIADKIFTSTRTTIGFDPSDGGDEAAVITRRGSEVIRVESYNLEFGDCCRVAHETAGSYRAAEICYDVVGLGIGVLAVISNFPRSDNYIKTPFNGSNSPENPFDRYRDDLLNKEVFKNRRAQAFKSVADRMYNSWLYKTRGTIFHEDELITINSNCNNLNELRSELTSIKLVHKTGSALIQIESKIDLKKRGVNSPNLADAFVYAFNGDMSYLEIYDKPNRIQKKWIR